MNIAPPPLPRKVDMNPPLPIGVHVHKSIITPLTTLLVTLFRAYPGRQQRRLPLESVLKLEA